MPTEQVDAVSAKMKEDQITLAEITNAQAYDRLWRPNMRRLLAYAKSIGAHRVDEAEDLVIEVIEEVWKKITNGDYDIGGQAPAISVIYKLMRQRLIDKRRRESRNQRLVDEIELREDLVSTDQEEFRVFTLDIVNKSADLRTVMKDLSATDIAIIEAIKADEPVSNVATKHGISRQRASQRKVTAFHLLRDRLIARGWTCTEAIHGSV